MTPADSCKTHDATSLQSSRLAMTLRGAYRLVLHTCHDAKGKTSLLDVVAQHNESAEL